jgi:hypothetical protein
MTDFIGYSIDGEVTTWMRESETDIVEVVFIVCVAIAVGVLISWWVIPLRAVLRPFRKKKFYCKKK